MTRPNAATFARARALLTQAEDAIDALAADPRQATPERAREIRELLDAVADLRLDRELAHVERIR